MPTKTRIRVKNEIYEGELEKLPSFATHVLTWTRKEQIENAQEDGTTDELAPPLTPEERRKHGIG